MMDPARRLRHAHRDPLCPAQSPPQRLPKVVAITSPAETKAQATGLPCSLAPTTVEGRRPVTVHRVRAAGSLEHEQANAVFRERSQTGSYAPGSSAEVPGASRWESASRPGKSR